MHGIEGDDGRTRITLEGLSGSSAPGDHSVGRAAEHAAAVARALAAAGYEPRHLSITFSETGDLVVVARVDEGEATEPVVVRVPARRELIARAPVRPAVRPAIAGRVAVAVVLGLALGFLGLPRLELPTVTPQVVEPTPVAAQAVIAQVEAPAAQPTLALPTFAPTPTAIPIPASIFTPESLLSVGPFSGPIAGWLNDPNDTAWFGDGVYHLFARNPGNFVAVGVPLKQRLQDAQLSAQFHKLGGPPGGGYGLIFRDQSPSTNRDGRGQSGNYLVAEIGDRGDVGVWQRDQTRWIDIVPWTHSDDVHTNTAANQLTVAMHGPSLQVMVNGNIVADVSYDRIPPTGGIGVFAGGDLNNVALDWLRIDKTD